MKYKIRSINLVKYNPNLFLNKTGKYEMFGGDRTLITTLAMGTLFALYRKKVNTLRNCSVREGIWLTNLFFLYGGIVGLFYSSIYFFKWQVLLNGISAYYLLERYPSSASQKKKNIYRLKDVENKDECYNFSEGYFKSFHL